MAESAFLEASAQLLLIRFFLHFLSVGCSLILTCWTTGPNWGWRPLPWLDPTHRLSPVLSPGSFWMLMSVPHTLTMWGPDNS